MLLTISSTIVPATDLGHLLHKNPGRTDAQEVPLSFGMGHVFWTEVSEDRCTAALHVECGLPGQDNGPQGRDGEQAYITDLPYSAGSYLTAAIQRAFGTAVSGRCASRPELAETPIPLDIEITPVACRAAVSAGELFEPLGWAVADTPLPLDPDFPAWGSLHHRIRLTGELRLCDALRHICVLLPVLDGRKHYFISEDEVSKLMRLGEGWLRDHPRAAYITRRYVGFRPLAQVAEKALLAGPEIGADGEDPPDGLPHERPLALQEARISTAVRRLVGSGAARIADLGCGEGDLIAALLAEGRVAHVTGVDPSPRNLAKAARRLGLNRMGEAARARVDLFQGSATYPDSRLAGCDAVAMLEVIEHIDPWRLEAMEAAVFGGMRPRTVVITTPNREWNAGIPALRDGGLRHRDHRFEWTRAEFNAWTSAVCTRHGYRHEWFAVGADVPETGPATQGAAFTRA